MLAQLIGGRIALASTLLGALSVGAWAARSDLVQDRLYDHLEHAQDRLNEGRLAEATAYADMVLLRRDVKVFVDFSAVPDRQRADAERAYAEAKAQWTEAAHGEVLFVETVERLASVRVVFAPDVELAGQDVAGLCVWTRQVIGWPDDHFVYQVQADITIRTKRPCGRVMSYENMLQTLLHEIGHVMGLDDSRYGGEVMAPMRLDRPATRLSAREIAAFHQLRSKARAVTDEVAMRSRWSLWSMPTV